MPLTKKMCPAEYFGYRFFIGFKAEVKSRLIAATDKLSQTPVQTFPVRSLKLQAEINELQEIFGKIEDLWDLKDLKAATAEVFQLGIQFDNPLVKVMTPEEFMSLEFITVIHEDIKGRIAEVENAFEILELTDPQEQGYEEDQVKNQAVQDLLTELNEWIIIFLGGKEKDEFWDNVLSPPDDIELEIEME
jgi:hypothetical protein